MKNEIKWNTYYLARSDFRKREIRKIKRITIKHSEEFQLSAIFAASKKDP